MVGILSFFSKIPLINYFYISLGALAAITMFWFGTMFGENTATRNERKVCTLEKAATIAEFEAYRLQTNKNIEVLKKNADDWKNALSDAQIRAIESARKQNEQKQQVRVVTNTLTKTIEKQIPVIKETKNGCTLQDIIINTDASDRLRNCYSAENPASCATSGRN